MKKRTKNFLIFLLAAGLGVGIVGTLSKGFEDWSIFKPVDPDEGQEVLAINFSDVYGMKDSVTHQEFTNKAADGTAGNAWLGLTNQATTEKDLIGRNKFVVGAENARQDIEVEEGEEAPFIHNGDLVPGSIVEAEILMGDISVLPIKGETVAEYINIVYIDFTSSLEFKKVTDITWKYSFEHSSKDNFKVVPIYYQLEKGEFYGLGDLSTEFVPWLLAEDSIYHDFVKYENQNLIIKTRQTLTVNVAGYIEELADDYSMRHATGFGLAIYGNSTDNRVTIESLKVRHTDSELLPTEQVIGDHPLYTFIEDVEVPPVEELANTEGVNVQSANKMEIRKTAVGENLDGRPFITMSYTLLPANTTDTSIVAQVAWVDSEIELDASLYLSAELDYNAKTLKVTCLQDFSSQMKVTLKSIVDSSKNAVITFDLGQKFLGFKENLSGLSYSKAFALGQSEKVSEAVLIDSDLIKGFSTTFSVPLTAAQKKVTIDSDSIEFVEESAEFVWWDEAPYPESALTSLDNDLGIVPLNESLVDDIKVRVNDDIGFSFSSIGFEFEEEVSFAAGQKEFLFSNASYVGYHFQVALDLMVGSVSESVVIDYYYSIAVSNLIIPLQSISPEIPSYTF